MQGTNRARLFRFYAMTGVGRLADTAASAAAQAHPSALTNFVQGARANGLAMRVDVVGPSGKP